MHVTTVTCVHMVDRGNNLHNIAVPENYRSLAQIFYNNNNMITCITEQQSGIKL